MNKKVKKFLSEDEQQDGPTPSMGIILGEELRARVREMAEKEDRTISSMIRVLLIEAMESRRKRKRNG